MSIIWKKIKNFDNYEVSNTGEIRSLKFRNTKNTRKLKQNKGTNGYMQVSLCKKGKAKRISVHRLVAQEFIPNPENKKDVNHINGIKTDNRAKNLEWTTRSENQIHAYRTLKRKTLKGKCGSLCHKAKIILQIKDDKIIAKFYGTMEAMRKTGIPYISIWNVCVGRMKSAGGYNWEFQDKHKNNNIFIQGE